MKQYEAYKDSGIQWLGKIPSHWAVTPLKFNLSLKGRIGWNGLKSDEFKEESYAYLVTGQDFVGKDIDWKSCYQIDQARYDEDPFIQLSDGDLLVTKDGTIGKIARVLNLDKPACLNSGIFVVKQITGVYNQDYLYWTLVSSQLSEFNLYMSTGSTIQHLYQNVFENMPLIVPPLAEQEVIAAYLDLKVGQIDAILSEKEAMVEQLQQYRKSLISETVTRGLNPDAPMKDSGIDWIGQIPAHWHLVKLKSIAKVNGRIGYRGYTTEDLVHDGNGAYAIGGKHISKCVLDLSQPDFISWEKYYESPEIMVKKGDLLMAQRGSLGKVALVRDNIGEATINPSLVLINNLKIGDVFLYYYLVSNSCLTYIQLLNTATAVPMISQNQIENLFVLVPPVVEQHAISEFLDKKTKELDTTISELHSQIGDLKAYKSSVITEAVTGKVDLRDWKPSEDNA